jgi:elongation factor 1-gamma
MAPAPIGILHYIEEQAYKAQKALIAAKFNGIALTAQKFDFAKEGKKPAFLAMNPMAKVPFLETDMGCIAQSNAIARFVARCRADTGIYGNSFDDEGQIDTWMEFSTYELEIPIAVWLYPVLGLMEQPPAAASENAKKDVAKALAALEDRLKVSPFLVGDSVTLADIVLVCVLKEAFARLFDPAFRKPYAKVVAWFELCCKMPQFSAVLGSVSLCKQAEKPQPVKPAFAALTHPVAPKTDAKKAEPKKDAKTASPKAKASAAPAAPAGGLSADVEAQIKVVGDEIRELKAKLKAEGLSGGKINTNEGIVALVAKLSALKAQGASGGAAPAAAPAAAKSPKAAPAAAPAAAGGATDAQVTAVGDQIRVLKEKLKGEGLSGKKINDHEEVKSLVAKLQELKKQLA